MINDNEVVTIKIILACITHFTPVNIIGMRAVSVRPSPLLVSVSDPGHITLMQDNKQSREAEIFLKIQ